MNRQQERKQGKPRRALKLKERPTPAGQPTRVRVFAWGDGNAGLVLFDPDEAGKAHLSISHKYRYPTWDEIKAAWYQLARPGITGAMYFPPESEFVNVHERCFHVFEVIEPQE